MADDSARVARSDGAEEQEGDRREPGGLPPILTVDELAEFLRLNRKTVYEAVSRGEIPGVRRIGHTFRISRDAVLHWLRSQGGFGSRRRPAP